MTSQRPDPRMPAPASRLASGGGMSGPGRLLAWLLFVAMVLAPMLGQMHRVVHQAGGASSIGTAIHAPHSAQPQVQAPADEVHALFDGHGPAGCQLLDQHHGGLAGPPAALVLPALWAVQAMPCPRPTVGDGRTLTAFFDARAPPRPVTAALKS